MIPKTLSNKVLANIMHCYILKDISIEEEDIGVVLERIYAVKGGNNE